MKNLTIDMNTMIKESAEKSYELAQAICESGVEDSITRHGMTELAREWYYAKKHFMKMMNGQTSVEMVVESDLDEDGIKEMLSDYVRKIENGKFTYKRESYELQQLKIEDIHDYATYYFNRFMNSNVAVHTVSNNKITEGTLLNYNFVKMCQQLNIDVDKIVGMKFTKFFIMLLKSFLAYRNFEDDTVGKLEIEIVSQDFSQLINTIKTAKRKQTVILSCALEDFISMSHGNNWHSCHNLGSDYGQGCIAYAMSPNVLIAYVKNSHGNHLKSWRQVVYCDSDTGFAIGSRQYPNVNEGATKGARNLWQKLYNKFYNGEDNTNGFVFSKKSEGLSQYLQTDNDFAYVDIVRLGETHHNVVGHVWSTWTKENGKNVLNVCPSDVVCLDCGELHDVQENDSVTCIDCDREKSDCECCESRFHEDDMTWVDSENGYVCERCLQRDFTWCSYCEDYHRDYDVTYVDSVGESVCDNCLDNHFEYCEDCEEYYESDEMYEINGGEKYACKHCIDDYHYCEDCEKYYTEENVTTVDDGSITVCNNCLDDCDYYVCQNCDEYFTSSYMSEDGDFCEDCNGIDEE